MARPAGERPSTTARKLAIPLSVSRFVLARYFWPPVMRATQEPGLHARIALAHRAVVLAVAPASGQGRQQELEADQREQQADHPAPRLSFPLPIGPFNPWVSAEASTMVTSPRERASRIAFSPITAKIRLLRSQVHGEGHRRGPWVLHAIGADVHGVVTAFAGVGKSHRLPGAGALESNSGP